MRPIRLFCCVGLMAALLGSVKPAAADTYWVIVKGKVVMQDGSVPPFSVAIEKVCSNIQGSAPGPITNKKGEYVWRFEIDTFAAQQCFLRASHKGYVSTRIDASSINNNSHDTTVTLAPLIIDTVVPDPYTISADTSRIPGKAKASFNQAMKDLDQPDYAAAAREFQAAVEAAPKFAAGWHALGILDEKLDKPAEAQAAYERAIAADDKLLAAYVTLTRVCLKNKNWEEAAKTAGSLIQMDKKNTYPEIYLHQAVAQYELKNFDAALNSVQEGIRLDTRHKMPRSEYVLGRIMEAQGNTAGAKEHFAKYLELDPNTPDIATVRVHIENLGKSVAANAEPDLEVL